MTQTCSTPAKDALTKRDILAYEQLLCSDMARILQFEAHALYFPRAEEVPSPVWIGGESRLLLPLRRGGVFLGVLLLRGVEPDAAERLLPHISAIVELCLDNIAQHKRARSDALTGLVSRDALLERVAGEISGIRRSFASEMEHAQTLDDASDKPSAVFEEGPPEKARESGTDGEQPWHASLGLVVLRVAGLRRIQRSCGHAFAERLLARMGDALRSVLPGEAQAGRSGDAEFAVLLPGASARNVEASVREWMRAMESVRERNALTGVEIAAAVFAGYALFPQDWEGGRVSREPEEEAGLLLDKARLAAHRVRAGEQSGLTPGDGRVLGYGMILSRGGLVDQILPLSRARVTLGRDVGAREGQRFSVWSLDYPVRQGAAPHENEREPLFKGEVVLVDVREDFSLADILLQGDPAWPLEPGDRLSLLPEEYNADFSGGRASGEEDADASSRPDALTGLYRHGDFLARLAQAAEDHSVFALVMARFDQAPVDASGRRLDAEHAMALAARTLRWLLAERSGEAASAGEREAGDREECCPAGRDMLMGRYSLNSLLAFHPGLTASEAWKRYGGLAARLREELGVELAIGICCLPFLNFRAADALECCRKALEYALLLPPPHVGVFDSLALNISADKKYSQGDLFGALEEYRLALLADEENTLAWNSLGVCLSGLGRKGEAMRAFEEAVRRRPDDAAVHYNLGAACVASGNVEEAEKRFRNCLKLNPSHFYARIRLGELAENRGDMTAARGFFRAAQETDGTSPLPHRCMARIELKSHRPDKARECLHQALLRNPQDALSLHLMARMYLDGGEDAELAEALARQSVALRPERRAAWLELARALEAQGREREAQEIRIRAAGV